MKNIFSYLTNNKDRSILAFDPVKIMESDGDSYLNDLSHFLALHKNDYCFGYLSYDLKNEIKGIKKEANNDAGFGLTGFFVPRYVVQWDENNALTFLKGTSNPEAMDFIHAFLAEKETDEKLHLTLTSNLSKSEYLAKVEHIQSDIAEGKIEGINFCQNFYARNVHINPLNTFFQLIEVSKAPFSCYLKWEGSHLLCASPERYIERIGNKLLTQPIKGTAKRGKTKEEDDQLKTRLLTSEKERQENILTTLAVQTELAKIAKNKEATIDELCQLYSFETVHQLISTISAELNEDTSFVDIIRTLFPMGSMTGVPTEKAIDLIDEYETFNRGLYSGSVGYIDPNGNFDFNVVIRSVLYNEETNRLNCPVGGAITAQSIPEEEYKECLLKIEAIQKVLNNG